MTDPKNLLADIQGQLMTEEKRQAYHAKIKADSYMRWLAFYYLGRREQSQHELREKLLAKGCDPDSVEALLQEFIEEGYQSDERMTSALIKDSIGKNHGTVRIFHNLKKHGLKTIGSALGINRWIEEHSDFFNDLILNDIEADDDTEENTSENYEVDWLTQAVEARCRKYGDDIPKDPKEKARQLRFLQYRGFTADICFTAIRYNLETLADNF